MNTESIIKSFQSARKGGFSSIRIRRVLKTRKGVSATVEKLVVGIARQGISYDAMAAVKTKRESGQLPSENAGLPWGKWLMYPYIITHKGRIYLRFYPVSMRSFYFINGKNARKSEVESLVLKSELPSGKKPDCITTKLENVKSFKCGGQVFTI